MKMTTVCMGYRELVLTKFFPVGTTENEVRWKGLKILYDLSQNWILPRTFWGATGKCMRKLKSRMHASHMISQLLHLSRYSETISFHHLAENKITPSHPQREVKMTGWGVHRSFNSNWSIEMWFQFLSVEIVTDRWTIPLYITAASPSMLFEILVERPESTKKLTLPAKLFYLLNIFVYSNGK